MWPRTQRFSVMRHAAAVTFVTSGGASSAAVSSVRPPDRGTRRTVGGGVPVRRREQLAGGCPQAARAGFPLGASTVAARVCQSSGWAIQRRATFCLNLP